MCKAARDQDNRFCYYVGLTADAATTMHKDIVKPISFHKPAAKICQTLKKKDIGRLGRGVQKLLGKRRVCQEGERNDAQVRAEGELARRHEGRALIYHLVYRLVHY